MLINALRNNGHGLLLRRAANDPGGKASPESPLAEDRDPSTMKAVLSESDSISRKAVSLTFLQSSCAYEIDLIQV